VADPDLIGLFVEPLVAIGVSYMITGGAASVIYGDPRFTRDVDIVMDLQHAGIAALASAFDSAEFYVPPVEALDVETSRRVRSRVGGAEIWVAPIEYVILLRPGTQTSTRSVRPLIGRSGSIAVPWRRSVVPRRA
jgi:hypothetical protein